jgi:phosphoglycolate phosphatase
MAACLGLRSSLAVSFFYSSFPLLHHSLFILLMPLRAIIFDLDGTLINSLADLAEAVNRMLDDHGYPRRDVSLFPEFIGDGMRRLVQRALPAAVVDAAVVDACVCDYQQHYESLWHEQTVPYPGIIEVLAELRRRGVPLGVLSNKPQHFTELCCAHFFPGCFDLVLGARESVPRKPHPAAASEIAMRFALPLEACAYVGDSGIDMEFAKRAGLHGIGVRWGFRSEAELLAHGALGLISQPAELLALL